MAQVGEEQDSPAPEVQQATAIRQAPLLLKEIMAGLDRGHLHSAGVAAAAHPQLVALNQELRRVQEEMALRQRFLAAA